MFIILINREEIKFYCYLWRNFLFKENIKYYRINRDKRAIGEFRAYPS